MKLSFDAIYDKRNTYMTRVVHIVTGIENLFFSTKAYVMGTQKNRLDETVLLNDQNICLIMGKKIFTILR